MRNIEALREYCLAKKGVTESFPFGGDTLVFKVIGKVFALTGIDAQPLSINLKMDPELVEGYREKFTAVQPGYHMNKKHWNTVGVEDAALPLNELKWMIDHSYDEVVKKMPKKLKTELNQL